MTKIENGSRQREWPQVGQGDPPQPDVRDDDAGRQLRASISEVGSMVHKRRNWPLKRSGCLNDPYALRLLRVAA